MPRCSSSPGRTQGRPSNTGTSFATRGYLSKSSFAGTWTFAGKRRENDSVGANAFSVDIVPKSAAASKSKLPVRPVHLIVTKTFCKAGWLAGSLKILLVLSTVAFLRSALQAARSSIVARRSSASARTSFKNL